MFFLNLFYLALALKRTARNNYLDGLLVIYFTNSEEKKSYPRIYCPMKSAAFAIVNLISWSIEPFPRVFKKTGQRIVLEVRSWTEVGERPQKVVGRWRRSEGIRRYVWRRSAWLVVTAWLGRRIWSWLEKWFRLRRENVASRAKGKISSLKNADGKEQRAPLGRTRKGKYCKRSLFLPSKKHLVYNIFFFLLHFFVKVIFLFFNSFCFSSQSFSSFLIWKKLYCESFFRTNCFYNFAMLYCLVVNKAHEGNFLCKPFCFL